MSGDEESVGVLLVHSSALVFLHHLGLLSVLGSSESVQDVLVFLNVYYVRLLFGV